MKTVCECSHTVWDTVCSHVNKSVVFIDDVSAEILHWNGGLTRLLKAGAYNVKEFSSFEAGSPDEKKGVFIISSLLVDVTKDILRDIIEASSFQYVIVLTSLGSCVHNFYLNNSLEDVPEFLEQVEDRLLEWMGNMNYTAQVFHIPLFTINPDNSVFITPGYQELFPLMNSDLHQIVLQYNNRESNVQQKEGREFSSLKDIDFTCLPRKLQILFKNFISCMDSLLSSLEVREDIYSIGYTSGLLASELESFIPARNRRKTMTNRASILFVDRTLDVTAGVSHSVESLLDQIMNMLPRLPSHTTDVKIDMSPLCKVERSSSSSMIAPGCLATQMTSTNSSHLHSLIFSKQKDALMDVNRQLVEAASECNLPISLKGRLTRVTADQLDSTLQLFKGRYTDIQAHLDPLQVAMATSQSLRSSQHSNLDELISVEKGLIQCLADPDGPSALTQIVQMLNRKSEEAKRVYSLDDVLSAIVFLYSLAGKQILDNDEEDSLVQTTLKNRIMEEKGNLPPIIKSIVGEAVVDGSIVSDIVDDLFDNLASLAMSREHLQQFKNTFNPGSAVTPATQNFLVKQIVESVFDPDKKDLLDIEYKSGGLKDMLKSGFGLFRSVAKPRPNDHPMLILFIVGGVTATEIKQIQETLSVYKPKQQIVVGSTRLLTVPDMVKSILCSNNVNPGQ